MFCLRSWLPLLFIPTNASPTFILLFFVCTYFLNRPCVYCSLLLLILFVSSCYWSDRCFFDLGFSTPPTPPPFSSVDYHVHGEFNHTVLEMMNTTAGAAASAAAEQVARKRAEWTGLGLEWLRNILGKREWRIECMDVNIRL